MKRFAVFSLLLLFAVLPLKGAQNVEKEPVVVAYVTSWSRVIPDPFVMTHINYAFGHVNETFDGVRIDNPGRLSEIVELRKINPDLKVMLSIGGWGSGRFSEMAADRKLRQSFASDCRRVVDQFGLDGIDIDWEYPTSAAAGISSSSDDTKNYTLLMRDLRDALEPEHLLTLASVASADYVDFRAIDSYVDFVNIMAYDMGRAPRHHSSLYESEHSGGITSDKAVRAHLDAGVSPDKLVLGMPFYGRGSDYFSSFCDYKDIRTDDGTEERWDDVGKVPYIVDSNGVMVLGFDNPRSLKIKCDYVKENGLRGAMYWDYAGDTPDGVLSKTVAKAILGDAFAENRRANYAGNKIRFKALLYYSEYVEDAHREFAEQTVTFFRKLSHGNGFTLDVTKDLSEYPYERLAGYDIVIMPNVTPGAKAEREAFEKYMENGGGWIGFHAAAYNDRNTNWPWLLKFLGGGTFLCNNWPPQPVLLEKDDPQHPVTCNLPDEFVVPASEWYQWTPSPRENGAVQVLLSISPKNYPLGLKDVVYSGDWPVVWTNTDYRMIYLNMGHGDEEYTDATQNLLFVNAFRWVVSQAHDGDPFDR